MRSYLLLSILFLCISCTKNNDTLLNSSCQVQFKLQLSPEILLFGSPKSIPLLDPDEPYINSPERFYDRLEYVLYANDDVEPLKRISLNPSNEDFGSYVYDELKKGTYTACFLAHSSGVLVPEKNYMTFPYINDMFYQKVKFQIDGKTDITKEVVLQRIVSCVEFAATDAIPTDVARVHIGASQVYNRFNIFTGEVSADFIPFKREQIFNQDDKLSKKRKSHRFFTLVPTGKFIDKGSITALKASSDTTRHQTVAQIPIQNNRLIRYKGVLYTPATSGTTFEISIADNGAWADSTVIILE